jgi:DNA-directed RNA polymerase sigma subunit (sigma70/sigma32)
MTMEQISDLLRTLPPRQEKAIRLCYGLGCRRPHSTAEVAEQFGVSTQAIGGLLGAALRKLAPHGVTPSELHQAAQSQTNRTEPLPAAGGGARRPRCAHPAPGRAPGL